MYEDWGLIEASFTAQYGIRLRSEYEMPWSEFSTLLAGIMPETPLGQIVGIRSESDKDNLKSFTKEQNKIRSDWISRQNKKYVSGMADEEARRQVQIFQEMCKVAFA